MREYYYKGETLEVLGFKGKSLLTPHLISEHELQIGLFELSEVGALQAVEGGVLVIET